jgi:serine/threonine protein kinase
VWALGIVVFKMLTGKHPFYAEGDSEEFYIAKIADQSIESELEKAFEQYNLSNLAKSFIKRLLALSVSNRYLIS